MKTMIVNVFSMPNKTNEMGVHFLDLFLNLIFCEIQFNSNAKDN